MKYPGLCVDCTGWDLLVTKCGNGHVHIFGFYPQLKEEQKAIDIDKMEVTITDRCRDCGCEVTNTRKLVWSSDYVYAGAGI